MRSVPEQIASRLRAAAARRWPATDRAELIRG